jgi:NADH-quinone oxidoreductase subunit A
LLKDYGYIALFLLVSLGFAGLMVTLPVLLRWFKIVPYKPTAVKSSTFECGLITIGRSWVQYNPRYYYFALMMVAMDVMAIFIYPWALVLRQIGAYALTSAFIFIAIVLIGYLFAWRKKVLIWK